MKHVYAEFEEPELLVQALAAVRQWGPARVEAYTPYPVAAIERALDAPPSRLPYAIFAGGMGGAAGAYGLQWLLNAYLYPLDVGGRPPHFPLSYVPITFEMGVLFASLTAFFGVLFAGRLLQLWTPEREVDGIESATKTSFWLVVMTDAPTADLERLGTLLVQHGARVVRRMEVPR